MVTTATEAAAVTQPITNNKAINEPAHARAICPCCKLAHPATTVLLPHAEHCAIQLVVRFQLTRIASRRWRAISEVLALCSVAVCTLGECRSQNHSPQNCVFASSLQKGSSEQHWCDPGRFSSGAPGACSSSPLLSESLRFSRLGGHESRTLSFRGVPCSSSFLRCSCLSSLRPCLLCSEGLPLGLRRPRFLSLTRGCGSTSAETVSAHVSALLVAALIAVWPLHPSPNLQIPALQ